MLRLLFESDLNVAVLCCRDIDSLLLHTDEREFQNSLCVLKVNLKNAFNVSGSSIMLVYNCNKNSRNRAAMLVEHDTAHGVVTPVSTIRKAKNALRPLGHINIFAIKLVVERQPV